MKLSKKLIKKIEAADFSIYQYDDSFEFGKYSPAGQDFRFTIYYGDNWDLNDLAQAVLEYYNDFDVSYEAYIWLDDTGHGANGAPYDMKDVYEDMKACEDYIYELYEIILEVI